MREGRFEVVGSLTWSNLDAPPIAGERAIQVVGKSLHLVWKATRLR
jgi:hypothetical protein